MWVSGGWDLGRGDEDEDEAGWGEEPVVVLGGGGAGAHEGVERAEGVEEVCGAVTGNMHLS